MSHGGDSRQSEAATAAREFYQSRYQADFYARDRFAGRRRATDLRDRRALEKALDYVGARGSVLDCPCGTGRITDVLLSRGLLVTGADISAEMLAYAAVGNPVSRYLQADALNLPFEDGEFDLVVSMRFLYHLGDEKERVKALSEMARVSRSHALVSMFDALTLQALQRRLKSLTGGGREMRVPLTRARFAAEAARAGWSVLRYFPTMLGISQHTIAALVKGTPLGTAGREPAG